MGDRAAKDGRQVGFRPPVSSLLPLAGLMVLGGIVFPSEGVWPFVVVVITLYAVIRMRQLMVLKADHLEVTVFRTRRIPWADVRGFEPGSMLTGGTRVLTSSGAVQSTSPCSWWGGPAEAADLDVLRREAQARR